MKKLFFLIIFIPSLVIARESNFSRQFKCDWNKFDYEFKIEKLKFDVDYYKGLSEGLEKQNLDLRTIIEMQNSDYKRLELKQDELFKKRYNKKIWSNIIFSAIVGIFIGYKLK